MTEDKNNNKTEFFTDAFILSLLVSTAQICQIIYTDCQAHRKKTRKKIKYPSFIRDSPSIIVLNFLLAPSSFNRATTATGSVALRSPPSNKEVVQLQLYGKMSCSIKWHSNFTSSGLNCTVIL